MIRSTDFRRLEPGPLKRSAGRNAAPSDSDRNVRRVSRPSGDGRMRVAVVGAGLAGLTAARILHEGGHEVVVVDKGRRVGGRMSTRVRGDLQFDHGAQYFTARDSRFLRHVVAWRERGLVEAWRARVAVVDAERMEAASAGTARYVAVPGMNAICEDLASELPDCRLSWRLSDVRRDGQAWRLESSGGEQVTADALLLAMPAEQIMQLHPVPEATRPLADIEMQPCWAVMVESDRPLSLDYDAAFVNDGPLSWLASQSSRPGRPDRPAWVLHARPEWSAEHLDTAPGDVCGLLLNAARDLPGIGAFEVDTVVAHRWRYALARNPLDCGSLWFGDSRLALAGDWCHGSRIEGAFLSGVAAAKRITAPNG